MTHESLGAFLEVIHVLAGAEDIRVLYHRLYIRKTRIGYVVLEATISYVLTDGATVALWKDAIDKVQRLGETRRLVSLDPLLQLVKDQMHVVPATCERPDASLFGGPPAIHLRVRPFLRQTGPPEISQEDRRILGPRPLFDEHIVKV
jgi:hypothetical protein